MKIVFEERPPFMIARPQEMSLEVGRAGRFKEAITVGVGEKTCCLLLDLSEVVEIDSSGLGALVAVLKWVRRFGGSMRLCGLQAPVREVLELTMLHRILPVHGTIEEAMEQESGRARVG